MAEDDCSVEPVLLLRGFGIAFGARVVLSDVSFSVPSRGALLIVGPKDSGKSALLRTLAGYTRADPTLRTWGAVRIAGNTLDLGSATAKGQGAWPGSDSVVLVPDPDGSGPSVRQQIHRAVDRDPALILADDPAAGLEEREAREVLGLLAAESERRAIVYATRDHAHAARLGGPCLLFTGGRSQEVGSIRRGSSHS